MLSFCLYDVLFLNECHIALAKQIFAPELIPANNNGDKDEKFCLSLQKTNKILFSAITRLLFYVHPVKLYYTINYIWPAMFLLYNKLRDRKKCCESKHCYILYKLAISVGIELEL